MRIANVVLGGVLGLAATGCCTAASSAWDAAATAALRADCEGMLKAIDAGDFAFMTSKLDADVIVYDMDENNAMVRFQGPEAVKAYFAHFEEIAKSQGFKFASTVVSCDAHATSTVGFCAMEFDQTLTAGGQTMGPFKFRGTLVARKVGDAWKWVHWHGSFREAPAAPPAEPATK